MGRISAHAATPGAGSLTHPVVPAWVRHGIVLVGGFVAGSRGISAISAWRAWRDLAASDPSGAELYQTTAMLDLAVVVVSLALAALAWWFLRPPRGSPLP
jgi:hypothetical protein